MRMILLAGAALALSACGGTSSTEANEANDSFAADNVTLDSNLGMDANGSIDAANMGAGAGGATDPNTANMMAKDANTHDPDTNLANGM